MVALKVRSFSLCYCCCFCHGFSFNFSSSLAFKQLLNGSIRQRRPDIDPRRGGARGRFLAFVALQGGFRGRQWWGCKEDGEPVLTVQFLVRSTGLEILWGTPYGVLFVVEFC